MGRTRRKRSNAPALEQEDPQWYLENATLNPIAPFTGGVAKWEAIVYDDGTTYEGLAREGLYGDKIPHGKGTYIMGASGRLPWEPPVMDEDGNIITDPSRGDVRGDKYEGELWGGKPHGLGTYTKLDGTVYRGEFRDEFMKPGPAGQLGAVPENKGFKKEMVKAAANWKRIHDLYNFEYKPTPGSIEAEAREFAKKQKTEIDLEGALYEHFLKGIRTGVIKPNKVSFEDFVAMYEAKQRRKKAEDSLEMPGAGTELDLNELDDDDDSDDEEDFDEDEEEDEIKVESGGKRQS
eukprot:jgi/Pico_ML_1/55555/g1225.t2